MNMRSTESEEMKGTERKESKGFILITSVLFLVIFSIFVVAHYTYHRATMNAAERNQSKIVSFQAAEAGLDQAIAQLMTPDATQSDDLSRYPCPAGTTYATSSAPGHAAGCTTGYISFDTGTGTLQGGYDVWVDDPSSTPPSAFRQIEAAGHSPSNGSSTVSGRCPASSPAGVRSYECRATVAYIEIDKTLFNNAVFVNDEIEINNSTVAAYDADFPLATGLEVRLQTNSTAEGAVELNGRTTVTGDVFVGPGGDPATVIDLGPNARITGEQGVAASQITYGPASTTSQSLGPLRSNSPVNPVILTEGTYHYDSINISGQGALILQGKVEIFVSGDVSIGGNGVATSGNKPYNFILYHTGTSDVTVSGHTNFFGGIYAPNSTVTYNGSADFFGAVIADKFKSSGDVHYDQNMRDVELGGNVKPLLNFLSWRETNTTAGS